jgi:hypothetical protein
MGYHLNTISRGSYGEISKIEEELHEFKDAVSQSNRIMELLELSDLIGAVCGYLERYHSGFTIDDLLAMARATRRAFEDGTRKSRD